MKMETEYQWSNLMVLADTAISVSENEKASESSPSPSSVLSDDHKWFNAPIMKRKRTTGRRVSSSTREATNGGVIVVEKRLTWTDVNRNHSRLSLAGNIPCKNLERFLREEERRSASGKTGLEVVVVDGNGREYGLALKLWKMGTSKVYNLISKWNSVASDNALEKNDAIRVYAFRRGDEPCFSLYKISD